MTYEKRTKKVCKDCKKPKLLTEFDYSNGWYRNTCTPCKIERAAQVRREKRAQKNAPLPEVRHPWELLGLECRPDWSKV